ncbi:MAG TPA: hypothetical protein VFC53_09985 [Dehalococcoidia bacterium]|nr:hypothetical protein [Dehalococcoidia bacterium]
MARDALRIAEAQRSPALALRAAVTLTEILRDRGADPRDVAAIARALLEGFTEGASTPDQRHAREVLEMPRLRRGSWTEAALQPLGASRHGHVGITPNR